MHMIAISGVLAAAVTWATESIALEPTRPASLPQLDFSCYTAHSVAFTTLQSTGSELGIAGDSYGRPLYHFTTISNSTLRVIEFPEFGSMRREYEKTISELRFDNTGSDSIFGWSDKESMGLRIFMINRRDRLVSVLDMPPGSQTFPFGTLQLFKCIDAVDTPLREAKEFASSSERAKATGPILHIWRASRAAFPKPCPCKSIAAFRPAAAHQ